MLLLVLRAWAWVDWNKEMQFLWQGSNVHSTLSKRVITNMHVIHPFHQTTTSLAGWNKDQIVPLAWILHETEKILYLHSFSYCHPSLSAPFPCFRCIWIHVYCLQTDPNHSCEIVMKTNLQWDNLFTDHKGSNIKHQEWCKLAHKHIKLNLHYSRTKLPCWSQRRLS